MFQSETFCTSNSLNKQMNSLVINEELVDHSWKLNATQRNGKKKDEFKLTSLGHCYTIDKPKLTYDCVSGMPTKNAIRQMITRTFKNYIC